jgi:hypothetical protein
MKKFNFLSLTVFAFALFTAMTAVATTQKSFDSPKTAADALIQAASDYNVPTLVSILGPQSKDLIESKDPTLDQERAKDFVAKAHEHTKVSADPKNSNRATLLVGNENWPLPIPVELDQKCNGLFFEDLGCFLKWTSCGVK